MKKISIIIPTFNRQLEIKRAIESVLLQKDPNFEIVVCDNGSTDDTYKVIKQFGLRNIIWIDGTSELRHPGAMRNLGLKTFTGDYICFLDSDDFFVGPHLRDARNLLESYSFICESSKPQKSKKNKLLEYKKLAIANTILTSSVALNSKILPKLGYFPVSDGYQIYEDYSYWLRAARITQILQKNSSFVQYQSQTANSIRKNVVSNKSNLELVFCDFENWAKEGNLNLEYKYYIGKQYQIFKSFIREKFF